MAYTAPTFEVGIDFGRTGTYTAYTGYVTSTSNGFDLQTSYDPLGRALQSGSLTLKLENDAGIWNRNYSSSSVYGLLTERVPIRLRVTHSAATNVLWLGFIEAYDGPEYDANGVSWITLRCLGTLATIAEDEVSVDYSSSLDVDGAISEVMDSAGLESGDRSLDDSDQALATFYAVKERAGDALAGLFASEMGGALYEQKTGVVKFKARDGLLHGTADATWGDDASTAFWPVRVRPIVRDSLATKVDVTTRTHQIGSGGEIIFNAKLGARDPFPYKSQPIAANSSLDRMFVFPNVTGVTGYSGTPVCTAYIDFVANSAADGTGSDVTSSVSVTFEALPNGGYWCNRRNTSGSTVYLTRFMIRAVAVMDGSGTTPGAATLSTPSTSANDTTVSGLTWTSTSSALTSNNIRSAVTLTAGQTSAYLTITGFGAAIPSGATITGVMFEAEAKDDVRTTQVLSARLVKGGTVLTGVTRTALLGTSDAYLVLGGSDDLWGTTITPENVNEATFGVGLFLSAALADTYSVDHVRMTVTFQTKVGITEETETFTAELAVPNVKGGQKIAFSPPWISAADSAIARDFAQQMLRIHRYPEELLELTFAWKDDTTIDAMIAADLTQLIAYQDTGRGPTKGAYADDWYRIIGRRHVHRIGSPTESVITLKPSYNYRNLDKIAWDNFNRADAASLGNTPTGKTWTASAGSWAISSNKAKPSGGVGDIATFDLSVANVVAELSLSNLLGDAVNAVGIVLRYSSTSNYWRFVVTGSSTWQLSKVIGGGTTIVATGSWTRIDTAELRVVAQGNRIRGWLDRKLVADVTDSALNTNTSVGMYSLSNTVILFDDAYFQGL